MMKLRNGVLCSLPVIVMVCSLLPAPGQAQFIQQGPKLVGTGALGYAQQGFSVALSAAGNTAIVGGASDNNETGAAWVYTRSEGVWNQQAKLVSSSSMFTFTELGSSASLSWDGDTALVGGPTDSNDTGAAWVYTRSGGVWSQQAELLGAGAIGSEVLQGASVSLSAEGNSAIVGGPRDNSDAGAAWVYTRKGGVWSQRAKLTAADGIGPLIELGASVALSADGNTAIVGGPSDNNFAGAAWVFSRSDGVWTQQAKLVGTGAVGPGHQGTSVSISADGNTVIVGGPVDNSGGDPNSGAGAAWVFTRSDGVWRQQAKLVGTGAIGPAAEQGHSVSLAGRGNIAIVGGPGDNNSAGAAWIFTYSHGVWRQQAKLVGTGAVGPGEQGFSVSLAADGKTAMVGGINDAPVALGGTAAGAAWVYVQRCARSWQEGGRDREGSQEDDRDGCRCDRGRDEDDRKGCDKDLAGAGEGRTEGLPDGASN